jgi:heat shock protein HtpX
MNYFKTTLLLGLLTCLFVILGQAFGGSGGALTALVFAGLMNFGMFWFSDKIVLSMYRAKEANQNEAPVLYRVVKKLAELAQIPMPKVYIIENDSPNAFATGRSPQKASVAATTGILRILSEQELEGVMAHELAHVKNRDTLISTIAATMAGAITWIAHIVQWGAFMGGGRNNDEDSGSGFGAIFMAILAPFAAMLIQMAISRSREFAADNAGAQISKKPLALASALGRLQQSVQMLPMSNANPSTAHLFIVNPFKKGFLNVFSTHPPMEERIARLKELSKNM